MLNLLFLFLVVIGLALAVLRKAAESSHGVESTEWERHQRLFQLSLKLSHI